MKRLIKVLAKCKSCEIAKKLLYLHNGIVILGGMKMLKPKKKGYTLEIKLPEECGYKGYSVECTYKYHKRKEKYSLCMVLKRNTISNRFKLCSQEIDTQYISGTRETIEDNICRIVEQASVSRFFDYFIERFEYELSCFERGNELFEQERLSKRNGGIV